MRERKGERVRGGGGRDNIETYKINIMQIMKVISKSKEEWVVELAKVS